MLLSTFAQVAILLSTASTSLAISLRPRATVCNGHAELCTRSYGNVTFVGAHDSYAIGTDVSSNQDQAVATQLKDGVRMLQVQAHQNGNSVDLCHTSCLLKDGGSAISFLSGVKKFMDANPNEVVTMLIVNSDNLPPTSWQSIYQQAGVDTIAYAPPKSPMAKGEWPTLGDMIDSGKRLVTFMDTQADFTQVPFILDEFSNMWETPFDVTENSFPCNVNRTSGDPTTQLSTINHFLDQNVNVLGGAFPSPNIGALATTNAATGLGSLGQEVANCIAAHGVAPNFMLVDFYEFGGGSVFQVAASANGLQFTPSTIATPVATGSSSFTSTPLNGAFESPITAGRLAAVTSVLSCVVAGVVLIF